MMKSLVILPALALIASASSDLPRGASPENAALYVPKNGKFSCFNNSRTIDFSAVNDDYCDCSDGSDEPGTAACLDTTFYCHNKGHIPGTIPTSRVNDGICDPECCDGSDEFDGKVTCPNVCESVDKKYRVHHAELARKRKEGLRIKEQYRMDAVRAKTELKAELADLNKQISTSSAELEDLRAKRDSAETDERLAQTHEQKLGKFSPQTLAARVTRLQEVVNTIKSAIAIFHGSKRDADAVQVLEDNFEAVQSSLESDDLVPITEIPSAEEVDNLMPQASFMDRARFLMYGIVKPESNSSAKKQAESARQAVWDVEAKIRDMESKRDAIQAKLNVDVGSESAWFAHVGKCYAMTLGDYSYELCPFKGAEQKSVGMSTGNSLGKWGKWMDNGSAWQYDHGAKCWSGPIRNIKVSLECGDKEEVKDIAEPVMCEYTMTFVTPVACKEEDHDDAANVGKASFTHQEL